MRIMPVLAAGLLLLPCLPAFGADHSNLEEGLPVRVEDAYPIAYGAREAQAVLRYLRGAGGDVGEVEVSLDFAPAKDFQVALSSAGLLGGGDRTGSGDLRLHALYNLNTETLRTPAFALAAEAELPTGRGSAGTDLTVKAIATHTIGAWARRLHLNVAYTDVGAPAAGERADRWFAGIAYDQPLTFDALLVVDVFWQRAASRGDDDSVVLEAGIRSQLNPWSVLIYGVSASAAGPGPDWTATAGFQRSF